MIIRIPQEENSKRKVSERSPSVQDMWLARAGMANGGRDLITRMSPSSEI